MNDPADPDDPELRHDEERSRYEAVIDGQVVSYATHRPAADGTWSFPHTVTDPAFEGRGLAAQVVGFAMADARRRGLKVRADCSYVAHWFRAHPDQADLLG